MAVFKCKMCGGALEINNNETVATCEYCGTQQTLPKTTDEVVSNLFNRANNLRLKCEFDKAARVYEKIVEQDDSEAEAHWGLVLCKYGIEYVEDPKTLQRIPTCHRTHFDAVTTDADYQAAIDYSDTAQQEIYEREARAIDKIQKDILSIVKNEKPFDVFICYKETDVDGSRTVDSVMANDIYHQLTQEGFKVFFAAITLEEKLGQEYEPYIFAALNSAKVMLVLGTKPEYFNSVWVKNEWSRYLKLIQKDRSKLLIPCYRNMDAYDLPEEFAHLQAQDMGKIGFINDIVRGIKKISVPQEPSKPVVPDSVTVSNVNLDALLERALLFLEDGDFARADDFCEQVLNQDPRNAKAYVVKLMADLRVKTQEELKNLAEPFEGNNHYQKAIRFADESLQSTLLGYIEHIKTRNENTRLEGIYSGAKNALLKAKTVAEYKATASIFESILDYKDSADLMQTCFEYTYCYAKNALEKANTNAAYDEAARIFETIPEYKDSATLVQTCNKRKEIFRKDEILASAKAQMIGKSAHKYEYAIKLLETIPGWKDADESIETCKKKIEELKVKTEAARVERERQAELLLKEADARRRQAELLMKEADVRRKRNNKILMIVGSIALVVAVVLFVLT